MLGWLKTQRPKTGLKSKTHIIAEIFLILSAPSSSLVRDLQVTTWDGEEVIHWGDVIHSLSQHSDLLFPLVFEDIHVVLSNFALWPGSQGEGSIDDLWVRTQGDVMITFFRRERNRSKHKLKPQTLKLLQMNELSVFSTIRNLKKEVFPFCHNYILLLLLKIQ